MTFGPFATGTGHKDLHGTSQEYSDFMRSSGIHNKRFDKSRVWQVLLLLLLALCVYVYGLGGQYVPTIGDEMVYVHIARMTAESGQWLPLASELPGTRNTKPPLLFWQAMVAGDWGKHWSPAFLRAPSVLYTFLLSAAIAACTLRITRRWSDALLAACLFLAFFSTFRFGRPYLTSAPETFWLSLPLLALLWQRGREPLLTSRWTSYLFGGICIGLGLAYKSFALLVPAAAAWWLALIWSEPRLTWLVLVRHTILTSLSALLGLLIFSLWFILDPLPAEVWQEFVVAENASKFSDAQGYWQEAFGLHGSSVWSQLLAYPLNAGFLFFVVLGLGWICIGRLSRFRDKPAPHHAILIAWALVWLLVFLLPSQRSARYVIPAMPAIAIGLTLVWRDIPRVWFLPTLLLAIPVFILLARVAWIGHALGLFSAMELAISILVLLIGLAAALVSLVHPIWFRAGALWVIFLIYAGWAATTSPLDGPVGQFSPQSQQLLPKGNLAAPNNFNSQYERYRFLVPGAQSILPYDVDSRAQPVPTSGNGFPVASEKLDSLLERFTAVIWTQSNPEETNPPCLPNCLALGERWILRSRYQSGEITLANLWYPQLWLFRREWLLTRAKPTH